MKEEREEDIGLNSFKRREEERGRREREKREKKLSFRSILSSDPGI